MMPVSNNGGGECLAVPDVCMTPGTPPVPVPYPNNAKLVQSSGGTCSSKVKIKNKKAVTQKTEITMTSGDEAGSLGGVMSGQFKGPGKFKNGSSKVRAEGQKLVYLGCMIGHNGSNANMPAGAQISPSQTDVTCAP